MAKPRGTKSPNGKGGAGRIRGTEPGDKPALATNAMFDDVQTEQTNARRQPAKSRSKRGRGINLRMVAEVLEAEGFDPTLAVIKVLRKKGAVDDKTRAMIALEILQYIHPKKKAIEHSGKLELTADQVELRLRALMEKASAPDGPQQTHG